MVCRALLRDPTLILCDEVTSSVDAFAERDIVRTLRSAALDRTTITVAHRLSSIVHCDNILVIDRSGCSMVRCFLSCNSYTLYVCAASTRGELVEQGTHQQLLQNEHGVYRNMWTTQNENSWNAGPGAISSLTSSTTSAKAILDGTTTYVHTNTCISTA